MITVVTPSVDQTLATVSKKLQEGLLNDDVSNGKASDKGVVKSSRTTIERSDLSIRSNPEAGDSSSSWLWTTASSFVVTSPTNSTSRMQVSAEQSKLAVARAVAPQPASELLVSISVPKSRLRPDGNITFELGTVVPTRTDARSEVRVVRSWPKTVSVHRASPSVSDTVNKAVATVVTLSSAVRACNSATVSIVSKTLRTFWATSCGQVVPKHDVTSARSVAIASSSSWL